MPSRYESRRPRTSATTPGWHLEEYEPGGEEGVRSKCLRVGEPGVEQEERVDPPDERRCQRVKQEQQEIDALHAPGASVHDTLTTRPFRSFAC